MTNSMAVSADHLGLHSNSQSATDLAHDPKALQRLENWIKTGVDGVGRTARLIRTQVLAGGLSNETLLLTLDGVDDRMSRMVMRCEPSRGILEPYDIANEAEVMQRARSGGAPVPAVLGICTDLEVYGTPFLLTRFIPGEVPDYRDQPRRNEWTNPADRVAMGREFIRVLGTVQAVDWRKQRMQERLPVPETTHSLAENIRSIHDRISLRVGARWSIPPMMADAAAWLEERAPRTESEDLVLVHGDYKLGNMIWQGGKIVSLLDWELCSIGSRYQDLGYLAHPIMRERDPGLFAMLLTRAELDEVCRDELGYTLDWERLHYFMIYALYFHTFTAVMGVQLAAFEGGDFRTATMYPKLAQGSYHLAREIQRYDRGHHGD